MSNIPVRISETERLYVSQVLDSQFSASSGAEMSNRLEKKFAEVFGVGYAIAHINGTATLHAALAAAGVGAGDEVIVPPLTMASTSLAVLHANGTPVFADIDRDTFNIDPVSIEKCVSSRTRAIMPVALYGLSPDMDAIMDIARRHDLVVIEDAAESFLGYYKERIVGSIGHLGSFSFQSSKHMTSGEGGMVITDDEKMADAVRRFGSLGYAAVSARQGRITRDVIQDPKYQRHLSVGWNYRMPELCAAVALAQVERLEELVGLRIKVARMYSEALGNCEWLVPQKVPSGYQHSYWTYVLRLENQGDFSWYDFRREYMEQGGDGIYGAWQLTYLEPAFNEKTPDQICSLHTFRCEGHPQGYGPGLCPRAESAQPKLLQFKTNYMDLGLAQQKAEALARTIRHFQG